MSPAGGRRPPLPVPGIAAGAAVLLALSLAISGGTLDPYALVLVTVSGGCALLAARSGLRGEPSAPSRVPEAVLACGIALSLVHDLLFLLPRHLRPPGRLGTLRPVQPGSP